MLPVILLPAALHQEKWQHSIDKIVGQGRIILATMDDSSPSIELLRGLGLTRQQAITYLALLEIEAVSVRKVAERTGINRGTTYEAIKALVSLGLASARYAGKREYYSAESPEKIYDLIRDRRKEAWRLMQDSKKIVPELLAQKAHGQSRPLVRYYEDDDGIVTILRDVLQTCSALSNPEYYSYSSQPLRQYLYRKFPSFTQRRIDEGISVKVIAIGAGGDAAPASERKWLPVSEENRFSSYSIIYGDKVALISVSSDSTPYGVVIEDKSGAAMQRLLFDQLWATL